MKKRSEIILLASLSLAFGAAAGIAIHASKNTKAAATMGSYTADASTFYSGFTASSDGATLLGQLHDLMATNHKTYTAYSDCVGQNNTFAGAYVQSDRDPNNSGYLVDFYTQTNMMPTEWNSGALYNREHCWPQSLSNGLYGTNGCGGDVHHIRPTYKSLNSDRGNLLYGEMGSSRSSYAIYPTDSGATSTAKATIGGYKGSVFEPIDSVKGDVARIMMYEFTHYNSPSSLGTNYNGSSSIGTATQSTYFGNLPITNVIGTSTKALAFQLLVKWNDNDPVSVYETNRNNACATYTGTRNVYIDHPEYADVIFGDGTSKTLSSIAITGTATTTSYTAGETFSPTGLTVTATYSDGSTVDVTSSCTWTPNPLTAGTTQVTCTYGGKTDTYSGITVVADTTPSFALSVASKSLTVGTSGTVTYTASNFGSGLNISISTSPSSSIATASLSSTTGSGTLTITPVAAGSTSLVLTADDGATAKTATLSITVSEASSGGLPTTSTDYPGTYALCTSTADLTVGGKYMLVVSPTAGDYAMGSTLTSGYYNNQSINLSSNSFTHTATDGGLPLILGGASGAWTFYDPINLGYLGCTAAKTITHSGTESSTWTISFASSKATITYSNSAYGWLQYNASSPRFTTYTSAQTLPALYKLSEAATKTLSSISVTGPTKTTYYVGDAFNTTGLSVTAHYSDSTTAIVTSYTTSIANGASLAASDTSCTVSYTEGGVAKTANIALTINAVELVSIAVTAPTKTTYTVNETLDTTGMVVTATYNNGSSAAVTGYTTDPANGATLSTAGSQTVVVSYNSFTTTFAVTVNAAATSDSTTYTLISSTSDLVSGAKYVIASSGTDGSVSAMSSTQNPNNRGIEAVTVSSSQLTATTTIEQLTLGGDATNGWSFYANQSTPKGYLYAASSSSNYLRTQTTNDSNGLWTIAISSNAATITAKGTNTRNMLRWNTTSSIFSCYSSGQAAVYLYKQASSSSDTSATDASNWAATFVTTMSGICTNTQANTTASTSLVNAWASQYSAYSSLSSAAKTLVASTTTTDTNIQAAQAKYIYILNKYGTASFTSGNYLGLTISSGAYAGVTKADSSESVAILVVSLMLAAGLAGFYFLRKKKAI